MINTNVKISKMETQIIKLSELKVGSFLHGLAKSNIKFHGFYTCTYKGVKTRIVE